MTDAVPWEVVSSAKVRKNLKKYTNNKQVRGALAQCIKYLSLEEDPGRIGDRKCGRYAGMYGYSLTRSERLIYKVDHESHRIILISMGDHKEVYGHD